MTKLKNIILLTLIITLNSCKNKSLKYDTETYKIEIKKASIFHRDFTNHIQKTPLNIHAERISLKYILGILIKTDTSNIKFKNKKLRNEYYNILIEQKDETEPINEIVLNEILDNWNLEVITEKYKSFKISIQDSLKYAAFKSDSKKTTSSVYISKDSIKIKNCDLKRLAELLNSEFLEESVFSSGSEKIDYNWKKVSFNKLRIELENDLGILFTDSKNDRLIFTIRNN